MGKGPQEYRRFWVESSLRPLRPWREDFCFPMVERSHAKAAKVAKVEKLWTSRNRNGRRTAEYSKYAEEA